MYVIAGVSGNTGSIVANTLLAQGKPVRVIVRDAAKGERWKARGAEVAVAALEDAAALTTALRGATGAYLLVPPRLGSAHPLEENRALIASLARAVTDAEVPHVVLLSSIGSHLEQGTGPIRSTHDAEVALAATGTALTAVRAAYFLENWATSLGALGQGVLPTFLPVTLKHAMVSVEDIGRTAARALIEGPAGRQVIELSGPVEQSADDIAALLSSITGTTVRAHQGPLDAVVPTFTGFGISPAVATLFREMYAGFGAGQIPWQGGGRALRGSVTAETVLRGLLQR